MIGLDKAKLQRSALSDLNCGFYFGCNNYHGKGKNMRMVYIYNTASKFLFTERENIVNGKSLCKVDVIST